MFSKPANWDNIEPAEYGNSEKLPPGAYSCRIVNAGGQTSKKTNRPMLVLELDIDSGEFAHFYENKKKYAKYFQLVDGDSERYYKGLITAIEQSNPGFVYDFDPRSLCGKRCCAVFREEEFIGNDMNLAVSVKVWYITSLQKMAEGIPVPAIKKLPGGNSPSAPSAQGQGFATSYTPAYNEDDDLPF